MINFILQAAKKQYLAIELAKKDCLFLIEDVKSFSKQIFVARMFEQKTKLNKEEKLKKLILSNVKYSTFTQEMLISSGFLKRPIFVNEDGYIVLRTLPERAFFLKMITSDFSDNKNLVKLTARLDLLSDMRFYGSDIERYCENRHKKCDIIDWQKTNKKELYIYYQNNSLMVLRAYYKNIHLRKEKSKKQSRLSFYNVFNLYGNEIVETLLESLNPKDFVHLLKPQSKTQKRIYWQKTSAYLFVLVFVIFCLYYLV